MSNKSGMKFNSGIRWGCVVNGNLNDEGDIKND